MSVLLAMAVVAAQPINPANWITPEDYPIKALREHRSGYTAFQLTISPLGKPLRCEVTSPSGWEDLDDHTCRIMMKRGRFKPALDRYGTPAYSTYRSLNFFRTPGGLPKTQSPSLVDMTIFVKEYPLGQAEFAEVNLVFSADPARTIADCTPYLNTSSTKSSPASLIILRLGAVACQELKKSYRPQPAMDAQGNAVPSIQTARVKFMKAAE